MSLSLSETLALRRAEAAPQLTEHLPDGSLRCYSCGHRCLIKPGRDGICRVRSNVDGKLMAPHGYVAGIQVDPIEKKPFFHALPGNDALSFGMLGCDLHCAYCFPAEVRVATTAGMRRLGDLFDAASAGPEEERRAPSAPVSVIADDGSVHSVKWIFRHRFEGELVSIAMAGGATLDATPEHPILVTSDPVQAPAFVPAERLRSGMFLITPSMEEAVAVPAGPTGFMASENTEDADVGRFGVFGVFGGYQSRRPRFTPIRTVARRSFSGWVYNLEAEGRHTYLANGFAVHNCQNWVTSQALRDPVAGTGPTDTTPEQLVSLAIREHAPVVVSTYNEPLITAEWAASVMKPAKEAGLLGAFVSNGNATNEVLDYLRPYVSLYKIDLKSFDDKHYRSLGAPLENILEGVRLVHAKGFWLEVVTLIIPDFNDQESELREMARFLRSISPDIPWHVTGFHTDYRMSNGSTPAAKLIRAAEIGTEEGLRFVYAGNRPGQVGEWENTRCPSCQKTLIRRQSFKVLEQNVGKDGLCPGCGTRIPGVFDHPLARMRPAAASALPRRVR
ncbi:MAG TPA: radical SAM protein [Planctomycetota bacterium]|nr:radical SAM protein [Planctomycetota bacterium]